MTFSVSPGVYTKETDLSGIAEPFVGTNGCFAGRFRWGPCLERVRISNEETLGLIFGTPSTHIDNSIDFFVAAQYLSYSGALDVVRSASWNGSTYLNKNAVARVSFNTLGVSEAPEPTITILNNEHYTNLLDSVLQYNTFIARFPGEFGNNLAVSFVANSSSLSGDEYKYSVDFTAAKNNFIFSRSKDVKYIRPNATTSARSIVDLGDWLDIDNAKYQVRAVTLDTLPAQRVVSIAMTNGGTGYTGTPTVSFTGGGTPSTVASATANLATTGSVNNTITITNSGTGYVATSSGTWTTTGGNGTGANGTFTTNGSGVINSITVISGGTGYTSAPTIVLAGSAIATGSGAILTATIGYAIASITITNAGAGYASAPTIGIAGTGSGFVGTVQIGSLDTITLDRLYSGDASIQSATVTNPTITTLTKYWKWSNVISSAPSSESMHIVIYDRTGLVTGTAGAIIEKYSDLSFYVSARTIDGISNFWLNRINTSSNYIRIGTADLAAIPLFIPHTNALASASGSGWISNTIRLTGGDDVFATMNFDDDIEAYNLFKNPEETDAPLIIGNYRCIKDEGGLPNVVLANYLIQNIAEIRRDSVVFLSCRRESVVNNPRYAVRSILADVELLPSTSYATIDSGWKYIYDRYNDRYIWIPTSGDHAGCYSRTDKNRDPWYSAAGEQRGLINNSIKLAFNPNEGERDQLYANRVNPIVSFPGIGTMIYGDKTLLSLASGFNRIPTRRLFIVLARTLANAARFAMFEFNDNITRAQVYGILNAYLQDVKGRRGVDDYLIDVSTKVNTPFVVANNQFKGRIYIKPKYSINFIELNFINVGAVLSFDEAVAIINNTI